MLAMSDNSGGVGVNTSNGGKAKKPRKRYDILKTASCSVCGDQAAEHLHYGGIACYSCRAFFRRTVNSNRPILDCSGTQNCKINKETRKRCQWCRFEKCKLMGMKTSWVLTEEDKTKLQMRRESSPIAGINIGDGGLAPIHIKKEEDGGDLPQGGVCQQQQQQQLGNISVKQRHPSSPMASPPIPDHFDQNGHPQFKSRTSPYFQPTHHPGPEGTSSTTGNPFFANQFYPFQTGFSGHKMASDPISSQQSFYRGGPNEFQQHGGFDPDRGRGFEGQQASSLFPLNINKMQVSLSGNSDGVSFTIETHNSNALQKDRAAPPAKVERGDGRSGWHEASDQRYPSPAESPQDSNPLRHHQQSRTIFRCVSSDSNPPSCTSPVGNPAGVPFARAQTAPTSSWLEQNGQAGASSPEPGVMNTPPSRPESSNSNVQVWKLDNNAAAAANSETSNEQQHQQQPLQSFTLQETLFVEQLAAIDERVRNQVPMDPAHVRSFLNTAVFGTFITKITIMHAYQTCIKRIVRFANSLQDFVELPPDDMQKLLVANTVSIINIRIVRWLHPSINLKEQLTLCGGGQEMFQEALEGGKVTEDGLWRVNYDDVFASPWCCDSYYEDRYKVLMEDMHNLTFDSTVMVLLSVMCLFNCKGVTELSAESTIVSHGQKFSLLLHRHLLEREGSEEAATSRFYRYQEGLAKLREMAEILINKRLIC